MERIKEAGIELEVLRGKLAESREELAELRDDLDRFELNVDDYEENFNESLDEAGPVTVAGMEYDPSHVLKHVDPTAWRCMLVDYVDSLDVEDSEEYQAIEEKIEAIEEEIEELKEEIEDLEEELSELEDGGE